MKGEKEERKKGEERKKKGKEGKRERMRHRWLYHPYQTDLLF